MMADFGDGELQERWKGCQNDEEREGCFKIAMQWAEAAKEEATTASESLERLQRELEVLRGEDKERTASTKRLEALLEEQKSDNASVRRILSEKEERLAEMESNVESLNARVSADGDKGRYSTHSL